jgi:hypothetical protein
VVQAREAREAQAREAREARAVPAVQAREIPVVQAREAKEMAKAKEKVPHLQAAIMIRVGK